MTELRRGGTEKEFLEAFCKDDFEQPNRRSTSADPFTMAMCGKPPERSQEQIWGKPAVFTKAAFIKLMQHNKWAFGHEGQPALSAWGSRLPLGRFRASNMTMLSLHNLQALTTIYLDAPQLTHLEIVDCGKIYMLSFVCKELQEFVINNTQFGTLKGSTITGGNVLAPNAMVRLLGKVFSDQLAKDSWITEKISRSVFKQDQKYFHVDALVNFFEEALPDDFHLKENGKYQFEVMFPAILLQATQGRFSSHWQELKIVKFLSYYYLSHMDYTDSEASDWPGKEARLWGESIEDSKPQDPKPKELKREDLNSVLIRIAQGRDTPAWVYNALAKRSNRKVEAEEVHSRLAETAAKRKRDDAKKMVSKEKQLDAELAAAEETRIKQALEKYSKQRSYLRARSITDNVQAPCEEVQEWFSALLKLNRGDTINLQQTSLFLVDITRSQHTVTNYLLAVLVSFADQLAKHRQTGNTLPRISVVFTNKETERLGAIDYQSPEFERLHEKFMRGIFDIKRLKKLSVSSVSDNVIDAPRAIFLQYFMPALTELQEVVFRRNLLGQSDASRLLKTFKDLPNLEKITCTDNGLTDDMAFQLIAENALGFQQEPTKEKKSTKAKISGKKAATGDEIPLIDCSHHQPVTESVALQPEKKKVEETKMEERNMPPPTATNAINASDKHSPDGSSPKVTSFDLSRNYITKNFLKKIVEEMKIGHRPLGKTIDIMLMSNIITLSYADIDKMNDKYDKMNIMGDPHLAQKGALQTTDRADSSIPRKRRFPGQIVIQENQDDKQKMGEDLYKIVLHFTPPTNTKAEK